MEYSHRKRLVWLGRQRSRLYALVVFCSVLLLGGLLVSLSFTATGEEAGLAIGTRALIACCVLAGCAALAWQASILIKDKGSLMLELLDTTPGPGPLHHDKVDDAVGGIVIASGIPRPEVSVVADECRNAFTLPLRSGRARLCLTSGLIEALSREELTGVVAHEFAHVKNSDLDRLHVTPRLLFRLFGKRLRQRRWLALIRSSLLPLLWVASTSAIIATLLVDDQGDNALMLLLAAAYALASLAFCPFLLYPESFSHETLDERFSVDLVADRDALGWTFDPPALERALRKCHVAGTSPALALVDRVSFVCTCPEVGYRVSALWTPGVGCTYYSHNGSVLGNQWVEYRIWFEGSRRFLRNPSSITPQQASVEHRLYTLENLWEDPQLIQPIPIR